MTDKKTEAGDEPLDWDSALEEWDSKTFVPEVAKDAETEKPAALAGAASKALYRPPAPAAGAPPRPAPPRPGAAPPPLPRPAADEPPLPPPRAPEASEPPMELDSFDDDDGGSGATVIAAIPRELLRGAGKVEEEAPVSSGGGLGQLFAKTSDEASQEVEIHVAKSSAKITSRPPPIPSAPGDDEPEPSFVTSAKHVAPTREQLAAAAERLRRPSLADLQEKLSADGSFDPFADPAARPVIAGATPAPAEAPLPPIRDMMPTPVARADRGEADAPASDAPVIATHDSPTLAPPSDDEALDALLAGDADEPPSGPALHSPQARNFDPNDETFVASKAAMAATIARAPSGGTSISSASARKTTICRRAYALAKRRRAPS